MWSTIIAFNSESSSQPPVTRQVVLIAFPCSAHRSPVKTCRRYAISLAESATTRVARNLRRPFLPLYSRRVTCQKGILALAN